MKTIQVLTWFLICLMFNSMANFVAAMLTSDEVEDTSLGWIAVGDR